MNTHKKNNEELQRCELGLWASAGPGHPWCLGIYGRAKSPCGPEVGAGLAPLGREGSPPLMMIERPMGVCVTAGLAV